MESRIEISDMLKEIRSFDDRLKTQFDQAEGKNADFENYVIFQNQDKKIKELQDEVESLKEQISALTQYQKNQSDMPESESNISDSVHFVKFTKTADSKPSEISRHLKRSRKLTEEFTNIEVNDITIISVNLIRATIDHAASFKKYLNGLIKEGSKLVIDLTECVFLDSTFFGVLVSSLKNIGHSNGDIRIVLNDETESVIFYVTRMDNIFKVFDNLEEAVDSYNND